MIQPIIYLIAPSSFLSHYLQKIRNTSNGEGEGCVLFYNQLSLRFPLLCLADWSKDIAILDILNVVPQWDASKAIVNINRIPLSEAILRNVVTY